MTDQNGSRGMRIIAGNSNRGLAEAIAQHLKIEPVKAQVRRFAVASKIAATERASARRSRPLRWLKACSIGLTSGEEVGRKRS